MHRIKELELRISDLEDRLAERGEILYRGSFPLAFLLPGEAVRSGLAGSCEIILHDGAVFCVLPGQRVLRRPDGSLELERD